MTLSLKEILSSDTPSILTDKLNYNFDQLFFNTAQVQILKGEKGEQGEQGIAGLNGATWFNNLGDPNTLPSTEFFRPPIPGDYYIDNVTGNVWYYDPSNLVFSWVELGFSLKGQEVVNTGTSDSIFELTDYSDASKKAISLKQNLDGTNVLTTFLTQDPNRITNSLSNSTLVISKSDLSKANIAFTVDNVSGASWPVIDVQRPFFGATEKTQLIINSELVKLSSSERITFSTGLFGFVEIESGRLQFPTSLFNQESDITVTGSELRIRGKLVSGAKQVVIEDRLTVDKLNVLSTPIIGKIIIGDGLEGDGEPLTTGGTVDISHKDTSTVSNISTQESVESNSQGGFVIKSLNFDQFGHVTAVSTKDLDKRYYKKSEIESDSFVGELKEWAGAGDPNSSWFVCDGRAISRTAYSQLFSIIGTTYGFGDGVTTFNIPDFRGRSSIGVGYLNANGPQTWVLGEKQGLNNVTLNLSQIPSHTHTYEKPTAQSATGGSYLNVNGGTEFSLLRPAANTSSTGGNQSHGNIHPVLAVNKIIRVI